MKVFNAEYKGKQIQVYAESEEDALEVIKREYERTIKIVNRFRDLLVDGEPAQENFEENIKNLSLTFCDSISLIDGNPDYDYNVYGRVKDREYNEETKDISYDLGYRYRNENSDEMNFRVAHEMGHILLHPSNDMKYKMQKNLLGEESTMVSGLLRQKHNTCSTSIYGKSFVENACNIIGKLAIRKELTDTRRSNISADDIIVGKVDISERNKYRKCDSLINMLIASMRNDFYQEYSFEDVVASGLDSVIEFEDRILPSNMFLYGLLNDSIIIEREFDTYTGNGKWQQLCNNIDILYSQNPQTQEHKEIFESCQKEIELFAQRRFLHKRKEYQEMYPNTQIPQIQDKMQIIQDIINNSNNKNIIR